MKFLILIVLGALIYSEYRTGWIMKAMQSPSKNDKGSTR